MAGVADSKDAANETEGRLEACNSRGRGIGDLQGPAGLQEVTEQGQGTDKEPGCRQFTPQGLAWMPWNPQPQPPHREYSQGGVAPGARLPQVCWLSDPSPQPQSQPPAPVQVPNKGPSHGSPGQLQPLGLLPPCLRRLHLGLVVRPGRGFEEGQERQLMHQV